MDTPLKHTQYEAIPLVEWALTPMGHSLPKEEYASLIASIIYLDSLCFVTVAPLVRPPKHTKSCSDCLKGAERSTGQSRFKPWPCSEGGSTERVIICALNGVESILGMKPCLGFRMILESIVRPEFEARRAD